MHQLVLLSFAALAPHAVAWGDEGVADRLSFSATGRLRAESTLDQPNGEDRHRGRMRLRVGATYRLSNELTAEARVTTTSGDSNNPHWDFGAGADGFDGADLALDRFLLRWRTGDFDVQAGKFPHVFADPPVFGELVWDDDVHPSGLAAVWGPGRGEALGYDVRAAAYVAVENSADSDPSMVGVQGNAFFGAGPAEVQVSSSLMAWSNLSAGGGVSGNQGNTDVTGDFRIWESFGAVTVDSGPLGRSTGFAQLMNNLDDDAGEDGGWALGAKFGESGHQGDLNAFLTYFDLDANAVFAPTAQDDTPIAGTGIGTGNEGFIAGAQYWVSDLLAIKLWVLTSDADATDNPIRLRFDIDFRVR